MTNFSIEELRGLSKEVSGLVLDCNVGWTLRKLKPVLDTKVEFRKLDIMGEEIGKALVDEPQKFFEFSDRVIDYDAMGGFVIVGRGLTCSLECKFDEVMKKSREYIVKGDEWYVCDIIGERSLGHALVDYFDRTLTWLERFLRDENNWIKRSAGVAIHFFSKRVLDSPEKTRELLKLVEPHIENKQKDAVKGIGWGLKTIGKHHPDILVEFLKEQLKAEKKISRLMIRKALTYLDGNKKSKLNEIRN